MNANKLLISLKGIMVRICTADYSVPGTGIQLKKDDLVSIPVSGIHIDSGKKYSYSYLITFICCIN
jgi:hypothetical protein